MVADASILCQVREYYRFTKLKIFYIYMGWHNKKRILFLVLAKHGVCDVINTTKRNRLDFYLHIRSQLSIKPQHL